MVQPISNYETNVTDHRRKRSARTGAGRRPLPRRARETNAPTAERLAKTDAPVRMGSGLYRAPAPIERMRDRQQLAPDPRTNEAMFQAAEKLVGLFESAGLASLVRAQDMGRVVSGSADASSGMPVTEAAAHCRREFRTALCLMGWPMAHPHRGAGRLTVAVVCYGMGVKQAGDIYRPGGSDAARLGAAMDVLREGLFALAVHWRFIRG